MSDELGYTLLPTATERRGSQIDELQERVRDLESRVRRLERALPQGEGKEAK